MFILGLMSIFSAWLSFDSLRLKLLKKLISYEIIEGSRYLVVLMGIASLMIAPALYRQKRFAWYASVFILGLSGFAHIFKGVDIEEAGLCLIFLGVLLPLHKYCAVKSDPLRVIRSRQIFLASIIFIILYTVLGVHIFSNELGIGHSLKSIWLAIIDVFLFNTSNLSPIGIKANFYVQSLFIINSITIIVGLILALSPVLVRSLPDSDLNKLKDIAEKSASQSIHLFTLTKDYQHFYYKNEEIEGLISYEVVNRVAIAIGNPCISSYSHLEKISEQWIKTVKEFDWIPAIYQIQGQFVEIIKQHKFNIIPIGMEAVINLETFTLEGKRMQDLRTAKNKGIKEEWQVKKYEKSDWSKMKTLNSRWLSIHGNKENSFAMGKLSREYLENTKTTLLLDKENNLIAYLNNIELPLSKMRSVDLMRRDPDSPKGAMEFLFLNEIFQAQKDKLKYYDLGFSPLAGIDESFSDNKAIAKLFKLIYEKQKKYYDFHGLHLFKSKFAPEWQKSYLAYADVFDLPNILMALLSLNRKVRV